jgi:kinesin family member 21
VLFLFISTSSSIFQVVANQDKSGKLITELRARIEELEKELQEYKQGKRMVGEDGEELINDQYLENMELQVN